MVQWNKITKQQFRIIISKKIKLKTKTVNRSKSCLVLSPCGGCGHVTTIPVQSLR